MEALGTPNIDVVSAFIESLSAFASTSEFNAQHFYSAIFFLLSIMTVPKLCGIQLMYTNFWLGYTLTVVSLVPHNKHALGLATAMGLSIMIRWYTLQILDRTAWHAIVQGWFGLWSNVALVSVGLRFCDSCVHLGLPLWLYFQHGDNIEIWMSFVTFGASRGWSRILVGPHHKNAQHVYGFQPERSCEFWITAYRLQALLDIAIPFIAVAAQKRSMLIHKGIVFLSTAVLVMFAGRLALLPILRERARRTMMWLLAQGRIEIGSVR